MEVAGRAVIPSYSHGAVHFQEFERPLGDRPGDVELREQFAKVRADNDARLLGAFKPLYANLSPEQQQMANQLVGAHHHWHHRHYW